jgi:hypothetical protein
MNGQDSKQVRYYSEHFALMEMLQEALGGVSANKVLAYLLSHYGYAILSELKGNSLPSKNWGTLPQKRGDSPQKGGTSPQEWGNPLDTESPEQPIGNDLRLSEEGQILPHNWGTLPQKRGDSPQKGGTSPHTSTKSDAELAIFDAMNAF